MDTEQWCERVRRTRRPTRASGSAYRSPRARLVAPYLWQGAPVREQAVNVIAGVLDGLGIDQVTLVGNALGGLFSLWFALDRPSRVARVVLVGQPAGAIAGARADLTMGVITAPVVGRVATSMARLPSPRFIGRMGLRPTVRATQRDRPLPVASF